MRLMLTLFAVLILTGTAHTADDAPHGTFHIVNSAGFREQDGHRTPLATDLATTSVLVRRSETGELFLTINGTELTLYEIDGGLAALSWDPRGSGLLDDADILELSSRASATDVPAWGAEIDWPNLGMVQLVLLPLRSNAYTGFLVSHPGSATVVRQMELRKVHGPLNRPAADQDPAPDSALAAPAIN